MCAILPSWPRSTRSAMDRLRHLAKPAGNARCVREADHCVRRREGTDGTAGAADRGRALGVTEMRPFIANPYPAEGSSSGTNVQIRLASRSHGREPTALRRAGVRPFAGPYRSPFPAGRTPGLAPVGCCPPEAAPPLRSGPAGTGPPPPARSGPGSPPPPRRRRAHSRPRRQRPGSDPSPPGPRQLLLRARLRRLRVRLRFLVRLAHVLPRSPDARQTPSPFDKLT